MLAYLIIFSEIIVRIHYVLPFGRSLKSLACVIQLYCWGLMHCLDKSCFAQDTCICLLHQGQICSWVILVQRQVAITSVGTPRPNSQRFISALCPALFLFPCSSQVCMTACFNRNGIKTWGIYMKGQRDRKAFKLFFFFTDTMNCYTVCIWRAVANCMLRAYHEMQ